MFSELVKCVDTIRSGSFTQDEVDDSGFSSVIKKYTNMNVKLIVEKSNAINADIAIPKLDTNHPFNQLFGKMRGFADTGATIVAIMDKIPKGSVDFKSGKVDGVFTILCTPILINHIFLKAPVFTSESIAAILLHELGHLFYYYAYLGTVVKDNFIMSCAVQQAMDTPILDKRLKILESLEKATHIELGNARSICVHEPKEMAKMVQVVFLSSHAQKLRSQSGFDIYDARVNEQLADHFVAMHGGARPLVMALEILENMSRGYKRSDKLTLMTVEMARNMWDLTKLVLKVTPLGPWLMLTNPTERIYDRPLQRITFMKQHLLGQLKQPGLDPNSTHVKNLIADIDMMSELINGDKDTKNLMEFFWSTVMPNGRRALSQEQTQKALESLMFNRLYANSIKFQQLGAK